MYELLILFETPLWGTNRHNVVLYILIKVELQKVG